jgi:hypothetical protein
MTLCDAKMVHFCLQTDPSFIISFNSVTVDELFMVESPSSQTYQLCHMLQTQLSQSLLIPTRTSLASPQGLKLLLGADDSPS